MESMTQETNQSCEEDRAWSLVVELWKYHQRKADFDLDTRLWLKQHEDFLKLIDDANRNGWIEAWPNFEHGNIDPYQKVPCLYTVKILPNTLERLRTRKVHSQTTVDGQRIDLRNGTNQEIITSRLKDLATIVIPSWTMNLQDRDPRVPHACQVRLQKAVLLRGTELESEYPELWRTLQHLLTASWSPTQ
jgi:hypothetical protein